MVRILIPGPATDPHLRIRSPVLASGARTTGLILHFLNGLFDMNFLPKKVVPSSAFEDGGTAVDVKIWIKPKESSSKAFYHTILKFFTRVEGGDRRPQSASWRVGVSC